MALPFSYSWKNVLARPQNTLLTAFAIALWAFLFLFFNGFIAGLNGAFTNSGSPANMFVLRANSTSEINSSVTREQASILAALPEVARAQDGSPLLVGECNVVVNLPRVGSDKGANVTIRGASERSFDAALGRSVRIVQGRKFNPASSELVVSRNISTRYQNASVGSTLHFQGNDWKVVGVFDGGGTAFDSEMWGDRDDVMALFKRSVFSSVTFKMADPAGSAALTRKIAADQRLQLQATTERAYYDSQQQGSDWMKYIFYFLTFVFSFSMFFASANAIFAAVQARTREIGTLRAIGFSGGSVLLVFVFEAIVLGLFGGLLGTIPAALLIPRLSTGTTSFTNGGFSDLTFNFKVTPELIALSLALCCLISLIGGLIPSMRAARMAITTALREA